IRILVETRVLLGAKLAPLGCSSTESRLDLKGLKILAGRLIVLRWIPTFLRFSMISLDWTRVKNHPHPRNDGYERRPLILLLLHLLEKRPARLRFRASFWKIYPFSGL